MALFAVIEAENGRVALDILESPQGDSIDLILTDNVMPEVWHLPACATLLLAACTERLALKKRGGNG